MASGKALRKTLWLAKSRNHKLPYFVLVVIAHSTCMLIWWQSTAAWPQRLSTLRGAGSMLGNWSSFADSHSVDYLIDPATIKEPNLTCIGWRQTGGCKVTGSREPQNDQECDGLINGGQASGYCLMKDEDTGSEVRVMQLDCSSLRSGVKFRCSQAKEIAKMPAQMDRAVAQARWDHHAEQVKNSSLLRTGAKEVTTVSNGIVMVAYPKLLAAVHTAVRILRTIHNCSLPIELWFLKKEMTPNDEDPKEKQPILRSLVNDYGPVTLRMITDAHVRGYFTKVHAVIHSEFDQLLFLDADNIPVRDPTYLFTDSAAFNSTGAVFWPDFWHPRDTIFNIKERSLLWEVMGLPFVDMFEQESGQLLIDRRRAQASGAFAALEYLAFHTPNLIASLKLVHGDKDLFRLAWMKAGAPFHMVSHLPGAAGSVLTLGDKSTVFCGMTMVQFDPDVGVAAGPEGILFLHRNAKKLTGEEDERKGGVWTHVQIFEYPESALRTPDLQYEHAQLHYRIQVGESNGAAEVLGSVTCYGDREFKSPYFALTPVEDIARWRIHELEESLLLFGREAIALH